MKNIFSSDKKTFILLFGILVIFISFLSFILYSYSNNFYNNHTDDLIQYFTIMEDFTLKIKSGNLSFYNFSNYLGASFFSDAYYVPIDIFTLITFILSFIMQFEFAFATTELIKLLTGTLLFAYYLHIRGYSNKTLFFVSLIYVITGGNVIMMAFPTYYSMIFYIPLVLISLEYFFKDKKYLLPLITAILVFYDYYIAYTLLLMLGIMFIIKMINKYKIKQIKTEFRQIMNECFSFVFLVFLGLGMSSVMLIPSILYILNDTYRVTQNTSFWSFINVSGGVSYYDQYFRVIAKIFTPSFQTSYYGFQNSYIKEHLSLYITTTGFITMLGIYGIKKDRLANIYKVLLPLEIILIFIPAFYMLFSGNSQPYGRWMILIDVFNLLILAHVLELTNFKPNLHSLRAYITAGFLIVLILVTINYYLYRLFNVNIFEAIINEITGNSYTLNTLFWQTDFLKIDILMMVCSVLIIILVTLLSYIKKINFITVFLTMEIVFGTLFMSYVPIAYKGSITIANNRDSINDYLDAYLPYNNNLERIYITKETKMGETRNFTRTNLQMTNLSIFHSFYDANANDFSTILFGNNEGAGKNNIDSRTSLFVDQILGRKYILTKTNSNVGVPFGYEINKETDNGKYVLYENVYDNPFVIYENVGITKTIYKSKSQSFLYRQGYMLNNFYYDGDIDLLKINQVSSTQFDYNTVKRTYYSTTEQDENKWTSVNYIDGVEYLGYDMKSGIIEFMEDVNIHDQGMIFFYYPQTQNNTSTVDTQVILGEIVLGYDYIDEEGNKKVKVITKSLNNYLYYDREEIKSELGENKLKVYVENTQQMISKEGKDLVLCAEYGSYQPYEDYLEIQKKYSDKTIIIDNNKINVSFKRKSTTNIVVCIPVTYNENWHISNNDYKIIKINGGLTGVLIDSDKLDIDFSITFNPSGLKESAILSAVSFFGYGGYMIWYFRKKEIECFELNEE